MAGLIVLVTGVTRFIGSCLAGRLAEHPGVDRVIGVDAALPEPAARARMGGADFARVDIRNPLVARVIEAAGVDTVVLGCTHYPLMSAAIQRVMGEGVTLVSMLSPRSLARNVAAAEAPPPAGDALAAFGF